MEIYILDNKNLNILSVCRPCNYNLNLDEETNGKSEVVLPSLNFAKKGFYLVLNGLYKQFLFVIDDVITSKEEKAVTVSLLDISNIFDRKIILRDKENMLTNGIENYIANEMDRNFINSTDSILNLNYVDVYVRSTTRANVTINDEDNLYNFHTYLINCRQYKNIYTEFRFDGIANRRLKIDIENKSESTMLIDTTLAEVTGYNKVYEVDPVTKVEAYIREDGSVYNLYLRDDRTITTDKNDANRLEGRIETISCDTLANAQEEALNVIRANTYKHLVEFNIAKSSKLIDVKNLHIGRPIKIKTTDSIYDSYISAIILSDENFVQYKTGNLRIDFTDKQRLQQRSGIAGTKLDVSGGNVTGTLKVQGKEVATTDIVKIHSYSNIAEMIADVKISERQFLQTMGYYEKDDGGSAKYFVTENIEDIQENDGFHILLENGLVANLLVENSVVNIKSLGAKSYDGQNKTDIATYINYYMNNVKSSVITLFIPAGLWHCSGYVFNHSFSIKGVKDYTINYVRGTYITSLNDNQDYIFKIGDETTATTSFNLENISFTACEGSYMQHSGNELRIILDNVKTIANACLKIINANFGFVKNINFYGIIGKAMTVCSSWEITFDDINFQSISNIDDYIVSFETVDNLQSNPNISNCVFKYIRFEEVHGGLFEVQQNAVLIGNDFYCIAFEDRRLINIANITNENYSNDYSNFNDNTAIHQPLFDLKGFCRRKYNTLYYS